MARLYIGNLPHVTAEHELQAWVEQYGFKVESVQVIRDLETGASRGFAFVELPEVLRAQEAVEALNGQKMEGTTSESAKQDHSHLGAKAARPAGLDHPRREPLNSFPTREWMNFVAAVNLNLAWEHRRSSRELCAACSAEEIGY